jgi:hypothetical protein
MVQRVGINICQQYVPTLFVDTNGTEGGYWYMSTVCTYKQGRYILLTSIITQPLYSYYLQTGSVHTVDIYQYPPSVPLLSTNRVGTYC